MTTSKETQDEAIERLHEIEAEIERLQKHKASLSTQRADLEKGLAALQESEVDIKPPDWMDYIAQFQARIKNINAECTELSQQIKELDAERRPLTAFRDQRSRERSRERKAARLQEMTVEQRRLIVIWNEHVEELNDVLAEIRRLQIAGAVGLRPHENVPPLLTRIELI